ncbi:MAG: hypothetical protein Q8Q39_02075 [bacterium]|nr:hypothetical protein [bacterium]
MGIEFKKKLLQWYRKHGRHTLPWRHTDDPYHILVSEIMLQQTQVDRVIPKYHAFLKRFPTLQKLAKAPASAVLRAWQGMGYNRRALYLKRLAEICVKDHGRRVPDTYEALRALPGIGDYTANAVLSFAFNKPVALYDTNIRRIFSRVFFGKNPSVIEERRIADVIANSLFLSLPGLRHSRHQVGEGRGTKQSLSNKKRLPRPEQNTSGLAMTGSAAYHSALMDLGATVCKTQPMCGICPLREICKVGKRNLDPRDLKKLDGRVVRNPQSKFEGSDRQLRGRIIDLLRKEKQASMNTIASFLFLSLPGVTPKQSLPRIESIIQTLLRDGLIIKKGEVYALPK